MPCGGISTVGFVQVLTSSGRGLPALRCTTAIEVRLTGVSGHVDKGLVALSFGTFAVPTVLGFPLQGEGLSFSVPSFGGMLSARGTPLGLSLRAAVTRLLSSLPLARFFFLLPISLLRILTGLLHIAGFSPLAFSVALVGTGRVPSTGLTVGRQAVFASPTFGNGAPPIGSPFVPLPGIVVRVLTVPGIPVFQRALLSILV